MSRLELYSLLFQLLVPLGMITRVALHRPSGRAAWGLEVLITAAYLLAIALAAPWLALPWYLPRILAVLLLGAVWMGGRRRAPVRARRARWRVRSERAGLVVRGVLLAVSLGVVWISLAGRRSWPEEAVELQLPLRGGTYLVANGGSRQLINAHLMTLGREERYRPYRGQSRALDLVRVGGWGSRRRELSPDRLEGFAIYGDSLFAPCAGRVVQAEDGHPDRRPPGEEPATLAGNHVLLECGRAWVLLAHLQRGSVQVTGGDRVEAGQWIGRVGNSGRSDEPHLHLHAQTPGTPDAPLGGEPLPIEMGGSQPVRNQRIRAR